MKPVHSITSNEVEGLPSRSITSPVIEDRSSSSSSLIQPRSSAPADPQVNSRPVRRRFSAAYKLSIIEEADRCSEPGQIGSLLRREGLYSSHLTSWRKQRRAGTLSALTPAKRGPKAQPRNPLAEENQKLRRENERLNRRLKAAETIIEFQKKVSEILGIPLSEPGEMS
jgi:transposase-like protein